MKRIISVLLIVIIIMPFAIPFASAADAIGKIVLSINTDIGGELVDDYKNYITIETEGVKFEESNGPAVEAYNNSSLSYDSEFAEGVFYTFTIKLTEEAYYALPMEGSFIPVEINGEQYAVATQVKDIGSDTITYIKFDVELYVGDPMKCLKAVDFQVPSPVVGGVPADVSQVYCNNMGVNVISIEWFPNDPVFVVGTQYSYQLALETAEGFVFDKNIYLSHDMADAVKIGNGKNELKMSFTFPTLEAEKITEADFIVPAPVTGATPAATADITCSNPNIDIASISWDPIDDPFVANIEYYATISIEAKSGYKFDSASAFTVNGQPAVKIGSSVEELKVSYKFPATVEPEYTVTVTNGTVSASKAVAGTAITLKADSAPAGKTFDKWIVDGVTLADATKAETSFVMPENDVTAQAAYKNIVYKVTVINSKASASTAIMGDNITLTANQIDGKVFSHWEISGATVADKNAKETTVTVGTSDVTAEAVYEDCPCNCHQGGIAGFFYKIVLFFQKLFGNNKICEFCGAKH